MKPFKIRRYLDISPAFVAFLCAYFYFDPAQTFFLFLLAATLHESGHLLALRCMHAQIHKISLQLSGAVICTQSLPYSREFLAAAAGPAVNALCTGVFLHHNPRFALINLLLLFYNLLPFYPMDGGRMLRAMLRLLLAQRAADIVEHLVAAVGFLSLAAFSCYLTVVWHAGLWPMLFCALLLLRCAGTVLPAQHFMRRKRVQ